MANNGNENGKRYNLSTQTGKLFIVIRKNTIIDTNVIRNYCNTFFSDFAFIGHLNDINPSTNAVEGPHYHIVGNSRYPSKRLSTHLNDLVKFFGFDNPFGIEVDKFDSLEGALQYLTHQNYLNKTQHDKSEIEHNFPIDDFNLYMSVDLRSHRFDMELVYSLCKSSDTYFNYIKKIGYDIYKTNYRFIDKLWNEYHKCK